MLTQYVIKVGIIEINHLMSLRNDLFNRGHHFMPFRPIRNLDGGFRRYSLDLIPTVQSIVPGADDPPLGLQMFSHTVKVVNISVHTRPAADVQNIPCILLKLWIFPELPEVDKLIAADMKMRASSK